MLVPHLIPLQTHRLESRPSGYQPVPPVQPVYLFAAAPAELGRTQCMQACRPRPGQGKRLGARTAWRNSIHKQAPSRERYASLYQGANGETTSGVGRMLKTAIQRGRR